MTLPAPGGRVSRFFACAASLSCLLLAPGAAASDAPGASPLKFAVSFPKAASASPLDGRILLVVSTDGSDEPRKQVGLGLDTQQIFGIDVDGLPPGEEAVVDATVLGYPLESLAPDPGRDVPGPGPPAPVRDVPPRRRAHGQAADGPRRRAAVEPGPRQPLQHAAGGRDRPRPKARHDCDRLDKVIPPIPDPPDHEVHQAREDPERAAHEVLGPADAPGRARPAARGLRRASRRALPARHLPRSLPPNVRRLPRGAARPGPQARVQRAVPPRGLQPDRSRSRPTSSTRSGRRPTIPRMVIIEIQHANPYYDDSYAVNSANLGPYGDAITYELIPYLEKKYRASARAGRGSSTAARPAAGRRWPSRSSTPTSTTAASPPVPTRSTSAPTRVVNLYEDKNAYCSHAVPVDEDRPTRPMRNDLGTSPRPSRT